MDKKRITIIIKQHFTTLVIIYLGGFSLAENPHIFTKVCYTSENDSRPFP